MSRPDDPETLERTPLAVASNRGPVAFIRRPDGTLEPQRGVGGLVTAVGDALRGRRAEWIAAAITDADHEMASRRRGRIGVAVGEGKATVRLLSFDRARYDGYYNQFSNRILWFLHHALWDLPRAPAFGPREAAHWDAFTDVNRAFAEALAEEAAEGAVAFPQDYHLSLVPTALAAARRDARLMLYWHIPFCRPDGFRILPERWGRMLLEGMLGSHLIGFQSARWADNFVACCREVLGAGGSRRIVRHAGGATRVGIFPVGVDTAHLRTEATRPAVARRAAEIDEIAGDRTLILRVDRTELSKNILRGFAAYETLLDSRRDLRGQVVHLALLTPSRRGIPEYRRYLEECEARAARINERFGRRDWQPVHTIIQDDFPRTLAAYARYDVLIANSVFDGMNLIAREGPVLNRRDGTLVLSRNAGAAAELGSAALLVNPFDVTETADAIGRAADASAAERAERAARLRRLAPGTPPDRWFARQLKALMQPV